MVEKRDGRVGVVRDLFGWGDKRMRWEMGVAEAWVRDKENRGCLLCLAEMSRRLGDNNNRAGGCQHGEERWAWLLIV
ncbi:hypothetical protein MRB53_027754 [Persea americana]|uniref:Uncharacterized protein n=1 Tax=Persea americana TaxID=3435 RepID=A0ACC2LM02_PERAE|nr:hypothetical protein MRB53_027754 [Persea americana]